MTHTVNPVWVTGHYRFEGDDGSLTTSTFLAAEDTAINQDVDANFRLRMNWGESAGQTTATSFTSKLEFRINAGAWTVVTASSACFASASANETDDATSTTERLTTAPTGSASYVDSRFEESDGILPADSPNDAYHEAVFNLQLNSASISNTDTIDFRIVDSTGTETVTTIDTTPTLTAVAPIDPTWVSGHFRFEDDDGSVTASTFLAAEDVDVNVALDTNFRVRMNWGDSAGQTASTSFKPELEYSRNSGAYATVGTSGVVHMTNSTFETDESSSTTERLTTAPTGCTTYVDTRFADVNSSLPPDTPSDAYHEAVFNMTMDSATANDGDTFDFRLVDFNNTETITTTDTTPRVTAGAGSTTYEDSATFVIDADLSYANTHVMANSATFDIDSNLSTQAIMNMDNAHVFGMQANITSGGNLIMGDGATFAISNDYSATGGFMLLENISLDSDYGLINDSTLTITSSADFEINHNFAVQNSIAMQHNPSFGVIGDVLAGGNLAMPDNAAFGLDNDFVSMGGFSLSEDTSFTMDSGYGISDSLIISNTSNFGITNDMAANGDIDFTVAVTLSNDLNYGASASKSMGESLSFDLVGGYIASTGNLFVENISLGLQSDLAQSNAQIFSGTITLSTSLETTIDSQQVFVDQIDFSASLDTSISANIDMSAAISLAIQESLSAISSDIAAIPIQSIVLTGVADLTNIVSGVADISSDLTGINDLTITLKGTVK